MATSLSDVLCSGTVRVGPLDIGWSLTSGHRFQKETGKCGVSSAALSCDGKYMALGFRFPAVVVLPLSALLSGSGGIGESPHTVLASTRRPIIQFNWLDNFPVFFLYLPLPARINKFSAISGSGNYLDLSRPFPC